MLGRDTESAENNLMSQRHNLSQPVPYIRREYLYFPQIELMEKGSSQDVTRDRTAWGRVVTRGGDGQRHLTNWPNTDKSLTRARMAKNQPPDGPIFRTLREIMALPVEERLEAFVDRLDLLDRDECSKVAISKGKPFSTTNNAVRLKIADVGKQWLHDAEKYQDRVPGKLAALAVFNGGKQKAG